MNVHVGDFGIQLDADLVPVTTSRSVAERFGKRHDHVVRDIEEIIAKIDVPKIGDILFRRTGYRDDSGRDQLSYILTRSGFILVVMSYTGIDAFQIKLGYILAFDAMEAQLRGEWKNGVHWREACESLNILVKGQNGLLIVCEKISDDTGEIRRMSRNARREISQKVRDEHIDAISRLGGRCPCCSRVEIAKDGIKIPGTCDFDHYRSNQVANVTTTWPICLECHDKLTNGKLLRDQTDPLFTAYQTHRRDLPKQQSEFSFFGDQRRTLTQRSKFS